MIEHMSLSKISEKLRDGTMTSVQLLDWTEANFQAREPVLGAYKARNFHQSRKEAEAADKAFDADLDLGPLQGIPMSIKDMIGVRGYATYAGCSFPLPKAYEAEGPVVARFRRQIGVMAGKTHTVQFAYGGLGHNHNWGAPRNPWDAKAHRSPGGSSSGAGVSVVSGMALAAIGTDTAGSVRIPASATGICGLRPTKGRWSSDGIVPLAPPFDTAGPLAKCMSDLAHVFFALDEHTEIARSWRKPESLSSLRIGVCPFFFDNCDPGIVEAVQAVLQDVERAGARLVDLDVPEFNDAAGIFAEGGLHIGEFSSFIEHEAQSYRSDLDPIVAIRLSHTPNCSASEHLFRARRLSGLSAAFSRHWSLVDVIVGPTLPITPPVLDDVHDPALHLQANMKLVRNTNAASLLGLCALTIPAGLDRQGMPVGLHVLAPPLEDAYLLQVGRLLEGVIGTPHQRLGTPPMLA
ncbi:MAG: amidase [Bosea sp. (in: a-proteobacteria)]